MPESLIVEMLERKEYSENGWQDIRKEAATDMRFVGGDPWDEDDKKIRQGRPTIAPDELGQYLSHVINALKANPRGMKFSPVGNGANDAGARWYQDKAREVEYRSHAQIAYLLGAENAIQRSYGYVRVETRWQSHRSQNQEIWIVGMPDPDMVLPDFDAREPDSHDQQYCFVFEWGSRKEVAKKREIRLAKRPRARGATQSAEEWAGDYGPKGWGAGDQELLAEYWYIETTPRQLLLIRPPAVQRMKPASLGYQQVFEDEWEKDYRKRGWTVARRLRVVEYPGVRMILSDGKDILHEQEWKGQYIPIASCYGKTLYVPEGGTVKRKILSMTRFGRDPWKAYCYAASQELEVLAMVPKAPIMAVEGSLGEHAQDWEDSVKVPKSVLYYKDRLPSTPAGERLEKPERLVYVQGEYLQAIEMVKEGLRRAIQSAMGSNFMPTQAQKHNEKSGKALDKIDAAAAQGTYHFVHSYETLIRMVAVIFEDLAPHVYDYTGDSGVMKAGGESETVRINDPRDKDSVSTKGDYLVTVSTAPSSESERDAAQDFTDALVANIAQIMQISGPKVAAGIFAKAVRMRNLGPIGDSIADMIEPAEFKHKDGEQPANPEVLALQGQVQQLTQALQQAAQEKQGKVVEQQGKMAIAQVQEKADSERTHETNETRMAVALLAAKFETLQNAMNLFAEERARVGVQNHELTRDALEAARAIRLASSAQAHEAAISAADASHEERQAARVERQSGRDAAAGAEAGDREAEAREQERVDAEALE